MTALQGIQIQKRSRRLLMRAVPIRVKKADSNSLNAATDQPLRRLANLIDTDGAKNVAPSIDPLVNADPERSRRDWFRPSQEQIVEVIADLPTHLDDVTKALRRDQSNLCALTLDDRVGDECRTVHDRPNILDGFLGIDQKAITTLKNSRCLGRPAWSAVCRCDLLAFFIYQNEVGERSADINTNARLLAQQILPTASTMPRGPRAEVVLTGRETVITLGRSGRHQAVFDVLAHCVAIALTRIAKATTASVAHCEAIPWIDHRL